MQDTAPHPSLPVRTPPDAVAGWIRLAQTPGVGPATFRLLLSRFGTPAALFAAAPENLAATVGTVLARAILHPSPSLLRQVDAALAWAARAGNCILTLHDGRYPGALGHIADAPPLLYASGRTELLGGPCLGVVGSRNASVQGAIDAEVFAHALSMAGLTIVSGLALGIDTAAHVGALNGALNGSLNGGGATVAVVGTGPDIVYPARNRALWQRIVAEGCVLSEYAPGTPPLAHNFPQRNRIISGLSAGVLVVEAAARSGSLITARLAASQGREVFAIPGSIHSALSKGCHVLLREGARLVESAADVLQEIHASPIARMALPASRPAPAFDAEHAGVLTAMGHGPLPLDTIAHACARAPHEVAAALLDLELAGAAERLPDGRYQRICR